MTITEQLQFSVLTAPVASLDRRTLSQAWFSALYGSSGGSSPKPAISSDAMIEARKSPPHAAAACSRAGARRDVTLHARGSKTRAHAQDAPQDRRAPRSELARKIERAFLRPRGASSKASFTIEHDRGRVHVLLHSNGSRLKLIAICPPKARPHVAAALAQARYALAIRGIDLDAVTREEAAC